MSRFLTDKILKLKPYVPGEQPKERQYIKLNTNESPFPPSEKARALAKSELDKLQLYPDPDVKELTAAVANEYGVKSENVIMTNGSDEVLNFAFMTYCDESRLAVFPNVTYGFYKVFAAVNGINYKEIPLKEDFSIDVNDYIGVDGTVFIANPNAPTGLTISLADIEKLLSSNTDRIVVIDQAYIDFGGESAVKLIDKYDNLLVTHTFSKSRSMAGARLGFGIANKSIIEDLHRIRYSTNPYNVNRTTAAAGLGAILDKEYFEKNCTIIKENRAFTESELKKLSFTMTKSNANFVFAKHGAISGKDLYLKLKEKGVLVRHFEGATVSDYIRITVGSYEEMTAFIKAVKDILKEISQ